MKLFDVLYKAASLRNDARAVAKGKIGQRIVRKTLIHHAVRFINRLIK